MNQQEFEQLNSGPIEPKVLGLADLMNRTPRTLIYGYNTSRNTFHVYIGPDGLIHVLLYEELSTSGDGPRFLTLSHTSGEAGGLTDNDHYVPGKRVYPESCDFEFCQVLKRYGVNIPFKTFRGDADAARMSVHNGYAGHILEEGGCPVVDLHPQLAEDPALPKTESARALTARLIIEAARGLRVPIVVSSWPEVPEYVSVASTGADAVLAAVREMLKDLPESTVFESHLQDSLLAEVFGRGANPTVYSARTYGGEICYQISGYGLTFVNKKGLAHYHSAKEGGYWTAAVVGKYKGRTFLACLNKNGHGDVRLSQFGDVERFVAQYLRMYSLEPTKAPKAR